MGRPLPAAGLLMAIVMAAIAGQQAIDLDSCNRRKRGTQAEVPGLHKFDGLEAVTVKDSVPIGFVEDSSPS